MTPRDIVNIVFIVIVLGIVVYLFLPSNKALKATIKEQQKTIELLRTDLNKILEKDSLDDKEDEKALVMLDSIASVRYTEDSLLLVQIKLLWRNNYAIRKEFDSAFSAVPELPDF